LTFCNPRPELDIVVFLIIRKRSGNITLKEEFLFTFSMSAYAHPPVRKRTSPHDTLSQKFDYQQHTSLAWQLPQTTKV